MVSSVMMNGQRIGLKTLSEFGLDADMVRGMSDAQITAYFTPNSFADAFGHEEAESVPFPRLIAATKQIRDMLVKGEEK